MYLCENEFNLCKKVQPTSVKKEMIFVIIFDFTFVAFLRKTLHTRFSFRQNCLFKRAVVVQNTSVTKVLDMKKEENRS